MENLKNAKITKYIFYSVMAILLIAAIMLTQSFFLRWSLVLWLIFLIIWFLTGFKTKENVFVSERYTFSQKKLIIYLCLFVIWVILFSFPIFNPPALHIFARNLITTMIGFWMTLIGLCFSIWARFILGKNWSSKVTLKKDHELITTGPYAFVRHPIYTGILLAYWGLLPLLGGVIHLIFILFLTYGIFKKMNEEEFLLSEKLAGYKEYKAKTKKIIPFIY